MNQAFYQSKRNLGRRCEPASWPTDVINTEDSLPAPEGHDPNVKFEGKTYYMPMEAWIPTGPPYKPMPPMHSWFWREGFQTQDPQVIACVYRDCKQRKSNLLLNLSPDTSGRIPDETVQAMQQVAKLIKTEPAEHPPIVGFDDSQEQNRGSSAAAIRRRTADTPVFPKMRSRHKNAGRLA